MSSQQTPSTDTRGRVDAVYVLRVGEHQGYAFGTALTDGLAVFIPSHVTKKLGLEPGDRVEGLIVPNISQPEKSPWYLKHGRVSRDPGALEADIEATVSFLVGAGDAWTVDEMGHELAPDDGRASTRAEAALEAALETAHARGQVSKIVMFHQDGGRTVWFTAVPDKIAVGEFED